ncbi:MAG: hypothetical protein JO227_08305 [Acetobacteraceae bacterium]|nr:hypothetical protein [Acetobacteraceae bacterium]
MPAIYLSEAAEITGRDKATIHRAMKKGTLSFTLDANGQRVIDRAELDRWHSSIPRMNSSNRDASNEEQPGEIARLRSELDAERAKSAIALERVAEIKVQLDDMRSDRDEWRTQAQAQTRLLTDQRQIAATTEQPVPTEKRRWRLWSRG